MLIQLNKINKIFSGTLLFEQLSFAINEQEKIGLVGTNGTGKTTLFQLITGEEGADSGTISRKKELKIGYVPQIFAESDLTVSKYLAESFVELQNLQQRLRVYEQKMTDASEDLDHVMSIYGKLQQDFEDAGGYELEDRIISMLKGLGLEDRINAAISTVSGGERVRVELAKVLLQEADLLLLDEPTNHLDLAGIRWLENYLKTTSAAYLVISHDRAFLDQVTEKIVEIEEGRLVEYPGNYSRYVQLKKARIAEITKDYELQQKEIHRLRKMIRRYRQWGNEGGDEAFFKKAKELEHRLAKITVVKPPKPPKKRLESISQASRSGKEVIVAMNIGKMIGERLLFSDSTFTIYRGERIALLGKNGSGKSTLLRIILDELLPDEGKLSLGASIKIGYLPQNITFEQSNQRVLAFVKEFLPQEQKARQRLAHFGFYSEDVERRLKELSGGERVRLYLLQLFQRQINLLILDEPTNHLDIYAREEIEELLSEYTGTLLAVTHDRYFLQKNFNGLLVIEEQEIKKETMDFLHN
ncbi:MAG: ATP-binding cassette domain-containing protein [Tetragenococcus halophilus]|uniref:ribosomal protection-like ABC-F family protein n=1 Tax=Tetragenococcus halophilus TaxID=51669 RepID=UPI00077CA5AC|nr:ABC-F family ATP-binding cassette domain-containing protein [Tetragenococcus halophilus]AOF48184.1 ABC transporter [Tetragenococcus halophilus]MCF1600730.1 ATP-binding cassette domain-containing protein [Tetragenococcus halophilus]MCF1676040.1 ATP-binding cassette domain-containing protein [Tetragenococcus halophilus]MCF1685348.1 ATP-binding cassette domain-containing protein [Tetragenococcus halophilus]MCO8285070.1 ABC-F family ATP-binding cassette domain-containing protein [Tetragenococcu